MLNKREQRLAEERRFLDSFREEHGGLPPLVFLWPQELQDEFDRLDRAHFATWSPEAEDSVPR
ncbi:hypothetical protein GOAMR_34_00750 [Gordonia amarae NBRC 15530]|uniref:Uncharacterized protein n=1 Tax=Gordonia amarae NBRC 15530 TaxID=1075090 RepID=G7GP83_9ACTN|nr:hypothetical protein GOAMR_34_00750 [Gordonia amarae NBRC 15530]